MSLYLHGCIIRNTLVCIILLSIFIYVNKEQTLSEHPLTRPTLAFPFRNRNGPRIENLSFICIVLFLICIFNVTEYLSKILCLSRNIGFYDT